MRLKLAQKFSVLMILGGFIASASISYAQTADKPVERPVLTKGDSWTYRSVDGWTGKETRQYQVEFAEIEAQMLVFRSTNKSDGNTATIRTTTDLNVCRSMQNSSDLICQGPYKFPISVGQKTTIEKLPHPNGKTYYQGDCTLNTAEKIIVPAGSFDTLRVDCKGYWTRVFDGSFSGRYKETIWYAPSAKRFVKSYYEDANSNGTIFNKSNNELMEFKIQ